MKFSAGVVAALVAPMAMAFVHPTFKSTTSTSNVQKSFGIESQTESILNNRAMTQLKMAFNLEDGQVSNMFEGPTPLVKERDACGVGFIANTKTGGTYTQTQRTLFRSNLSCIKIGPLPLLNEHHCVKQRNV